MQLTRTRRGFTLTEMAVALFVAAIFIGGAMATLSSQIESRNREETRRRVAGALESVIGFAVVNRRLPCPARFTSTASHSQGQESFCAGATGTCAGSETVAVQAHGNCSNFHDGFLPAASLGILPVDATGFAVDAWGNRLRYVIARDNTGCSTTPPANTRVWTSQANLKTYGVSCKPADLDVCVSSSGTTASSCNTAVRAASAQTVLVAVFSTGKNGALASSHGADELENTDNDPVFVTRTSSDSQATAGTYDDYMEILPAGVVYTRLISAGVLP